MLKKTKKSKYEATDLTVQEVIEELPQLILFAKHGVVRSVCRERVGEEVVCVKILCDFEGEETEFIFERSDEA